MTHADILARTAADAATAGTEAPPPHQRVPLTYGEQVFLMVLASIVICWLSVRLLGRDRRCERF